MDNSPMIVAQCWDDGVTTDIRLAGILRRYGARATFNLCAGLHEKLRTFRWIHRDTEVFRLGWDEVRDVYRGFTIGNHSLTHPYLDRIGDEAARRDIAEGRDALRQHFGQDVLGFAYPFGSYSEAVMRMVREAGHVYARTIESADYRFPPDNAMLFHPSCHFLAPDFWARYERARECGVFYFWGHSYELITEAMWDDFEKAMERICADPGSRWGEVADLFMADL